MRRTWWFAGLLAAVLAPGLALADGFDDLRLRWEARLVGPATLDRRAPEIAARLRAESDAAQDILKGMHTAPTAALWDDIAGFRDPNPILASAALTSNARRLGQMAQAYASPGSPSFHDARLAQAVNLGLDWLLREHYTARRPAHGNWWDWQIGVPQALLNILVLGWDSVPPELRSRGLDAIAWYVPDARYRTRKDGALSPELETGANLLDKALEAALLGVLRKDAAGVAAARDAIGSSFDYVEKGDGFYRDGSFIQHGTVPYTGSYGVVLLTDYARLLTLLAGSDWAVTDPRAARIYLWARDSYASLIVDGAMPDAFRGRRISTREYGDRRAGRAVIAALAELAALAPPNEAVALRGAIKGWMARDRTGGPDYFTQAAAQGPSGFTLYERALLQAIAGDPAIPAAPEPPGARIYAAMDRAMLRGPGFAAVLSLTSPRTTAFEFGNGENLKGWWTGAGMLALYDADQAQFGQEFWATVDSRRLPGTTTDGSGKGRPLEWKQFPNPQGWVGGASLGRYAAIGMAFSMRDITGSPLAGRKSWFFLKDRILALGSGIEGGQGATETVVENRRLGDPQRARLLVNGEPLANGEVAQARWAHLSDAHSGSRIGYVFPQGGPLRAQREERSGSWREVNEHAVSQQLYRDSYQSLAIPHGPPGYAYLLLPGASEAATRAAAADRGLRIEANDARAAAVSLPAQGVYAANLWQAGSAPRAGKPYVSVSGPAAVVVERSAGRLRIAVAEPTQGESAIELELAQAAGRLLRASPGVTVLQTAPRLRLRIDTWGAAGSGFEAEFGLAGRSGK